MPAKRANAGKLAKAPKAGKKNNKAQVLDPGVKRKKALKLIITLIVVLLFVGALAGLVVCYMNDYLGLRTAIVGYFVTVDDQYREQMQALSDRAAELDARAAELEATATEQAAVQEEQTTENARLLALQEELAAEEQELSINSYEFEAGIIAFNEVVDVIREMDTAGAATTLETMQDTMEAARVLATLDAKDAAGIIDEMTPEGQRRMTEALLLLSEAAAGSQ